MDVSHYIEEFQRLCLRSKKQEEEPVKVARYQRRVKFVGTYYYLEVSSTSPNGGREE